MTPQQAHDIQRCLVCSPSGPGETQRCLAAMAGTAGRGCAAGEKMGGIMSTKYKKPQDISSNVRGHDYQLVHPATVGELRRFLEPFADDCPLMAMNWGAFRYVFDGNGNGNGLIQYT